MEVFQLKFVEEVRQLAEGFTVSMNDTEVKCKLNVNGQVADLIAKAPSINFIFHNGKFGCCSGLHTGQGFRGPGNKRVYLYVSIAFQRRTHEDTQTHAQLAGDTRKTVFGVKGRSNVQTILKIPVIVPFDYMHQVLEGEFTRRMSNWLSGSWKSQVNLKRYVTSLRGRV